MSEQGAPKPEKQAKGGKKGDYLVFCYDKKGILQVKGSAVAR